MESDLEIEEQGDQTVDEMKTCEIEDNQTTISQIRSGHTVSYKSQETE